VLVIASPVLDIWLKRMSAISMKPGHCRQCSSPLKGRSDKKFCDDRCRNLFNNLAARNRMAPGAGRIHRILQKNREILKKLYEGRRYRVKKSQLVQMGYREQYHTHHLRQTGGKSCTCVYDYGFVPRNGGLIGVVYTG
jgi:hypothetical protein